MVGNILDLYLVNVFVDNTVRTEVLLIHHRGVLDFCRRFPLVSPDGLKKIGISPIKANSKSTDARK